MLCWSFNTYFVDIQQMRHDTCLLATFLPTETQSGISHGRSEIFALCLLQLKLNRRQKCMASIHETRRNGKGSLLRDFGQSVYEISLEQLEKC